MKWGNQYYPYDHVNYIGGDAPNIGGGRITGFTRHGLDRVIQRGVKPEAILDAAKNPLKVGKVVTDNFGRMSQRYIGRSAEIVINPNSGKIISANPTSSSKAAKLLKQLGL
jgi:hypothetical protein